MKHSEIVTAVENAISSPDIDVVNITGVSTHVVDNDGYEVVPWKKLKAGVYGVVEMRVILPINLHAQVNTPV